MPPSCSGTRAGSKTRRARCAKPCSASRAAPSPGTSSAPRCARGKFEEARGAYEKAIQIAPELAAAHRNLGVLDDLYLGAPERALPAFERYQQLTNEDKPVNGWIAELRQRTGIKPPAAAAPAEPAAAAPAAPEEPK